MEITVNINEETFKSAVQNEVANIIEETVTKEIENNLGDLVDSTLEDKLSDFESYIDMGDLVDKIQNTLDYDDIFDNVNERLDLNDLARDVSEYIDTDYDVEDKAENLLHSYNPGNGCHLGNAFTDAVKKAIMHLADTDTELTDNLRLNLFSFNKNEVVNEALRNHLGYQEYLREKAAKEAEQEKARIDAENKRLEEERTSQSFFNTINTNQQSA
jgi:uncharacterized membrane-anchored protein YjiN (DUF445 family)